MQTVCFERCCKCKNANEENLNFDSKGSYSGGTWFPPGGLPDGNSLMTVTTVSQSAALSSCAQLKFASERPCMFMYSTSVMHHVTHCSHPQHQNYYGNRFEAMHPECEVSIVQYVIVDEKNRSTVSKNMNEF